MAIGRISGPMLFANLERQGLDLSIEGNLIYFDVNRRRIGIHTDSPQYDVHIDQFEGQVPTFFVNGNIIGQTISVHNQYSLPTIKGNVEEVLKSDGQNSTYWAPNSVTVDRKQFHYLIPNLPAGDKEEFDLDIGLASIVYALTVNRPVLVEVFATITKNEPNPYTFLPTLGHLTDDGTVLLNDGSVIQQRQYSIFANQEIPPRPRVYCRITNIDGVPGPVTLDFIYFHAITDNSYNAYNVNIVNSLPSTGVNGESVLFETDGKIYVWYNSKWNPTS